MKIINLLENETSSDIELKEYVEKNIGYQCTVNPDKSVNFDHVVFEPTNTPIDPKIKIKHAESMWVQKLITKKNVSFLPQTCDILWCTDSTFPDNFKILSTDVTNSLIFQGCDMSSLYYKSTASLQKIEITRSEKIKKITIDIPSGVVTYVLQIGNLTHITSFEQLVITPEIKRFKINTNNITDFKGLKKLNIKILHMFCTNIKNFYDITDVDISDAMKLEWLHKKSNYNGIINLMLCKTNYIHVEGNDTGSNTEDILKVLRELNHYLGIPLAERKDHLMDLAVALIDLGFEEAAEL